jgi:3-deoxy-manno-octulosonate cytidylyltransferase (CMP-KDO synthetase)
VAPICGKPLVRWVIEACRRAESLSEVLLATDDDRIALAAVGSGARTVMTRPDHPSGTDRVAEAAEPADDDVVVNIQGDEPLIEPALIDRIARALLENPALEMATAGAPVRTLEELEAPTVVKVVLDAAGQALYFSRLPIPFRRDGPPDLASGLHRRHIGIYGYRGAFLKRLVQTPPCALEQCECLEQLRALHLGAKIAVVEAPVAGVGVDCPGDVPAVEALLRKREAG